MELTWKSTLLLAVLAGLATWWLEQKFAGAVSAVAAPVAGAAHAAAHADPLAGGSVWTAAQNYMEIPLGGSTAAVERWVQGT